jgi:hypothetical protein
MEGPYGGLMDGRTAGLPPPTFPRELAQRSCTGFIMTNKHEHGQLFQELESRLAALEPRVQLNIGRDRWLIGVMIVGVVATAPFILGFRGGWFVWLTVAGLVLELCAFAILAYRQVSDIAPDFVDAKRKFAADMDDHFPKDLQIRRWLGSLPDKERTLRLAYVDARLESMALRFAIVFGPADKLGVLPALVGLFLQLQAIQYLSRASGVIGLMVLLLYGMSLWIVRFRLQMQGYARLLRAAEAHEHREDPKNKNAKTKTGSENTSV